MGCNFHKKQENKHNNKDQDKNRAKNFDDVMEDIMDIKSVQVKGDMLFSETQGKPRDHYELCENLASGTLAIIRKVVNKLSNCVRSMKVIKKAFIDLQEDEKNFMKEIAILRTLDHPNILKIYEFYHDEKCFYLISEFCQNGDMFDKIQQQNGPFHEFTAGYAIYQILSAIMYCHTHNIVHRDIKAENILIESIEKYTYLEEEVEKINIRISDFSSARSFNENKKLTKKVGTPYYIAPEVLKRNYNEKCDVWSIGVLLFVLLCGKPPFHGDTDKDILASVERGMPDKRIDEWKGVSKEAQSLVDSMLRLDPYKRISIKEALKHNWFVTLNLKVSFPIEQLNIYYKNIVSFKTDPKYFFQHATMAYMIHHIVRKEEIDEIRRLFIYLDQKGDGKLSYNEIVNGFKKCKGYSERDLLKVLKSIDFSKGGNIEYEEFIRACIDKTMLLTEENLNKAFLLFTKDPNQKYMSPSEFKSILGLQTKFNDKTWEQIIKTVDANNDNMIEYIEFRDMMHLFIE